MVNLSRAGRNPFQKTRFLPNSLYGVPGQLNVFLILYENHIRKLPPFQLFRIFFYYRVWEISLFFRFCTLVPCSAKVQVGTMV